MRSINYFFSLLRFVSLIGLLAFATPVASFGAESNASADRRQLESICEELRKMLIDAGFENVAISCDSAGAVTISYENRLYRSDISALGKILGFAAPHSESITNLRIIIKRMALPIIALQIPPGELQDFMAQNLSAPDFAKRLIAGDYAEEKNAAATTNSSALKTDVLLQPLVEAQLGDYHEPYKFKLGFNLGLSTLLARGLHLEARARIPLLDEIDAFVKESPHPYSASLNYLLPAAKNTFLSTHLGYFSGERYGLSSQAAHYFRNGNFALAARFDYTGFLTSFDKKWFYSGLNRRTYNAGFSYQFSPYGFRASMQYGKYLLGDRGVRVALGRYLNESRLDFFAVATTAEHWVGVELGVPLFPDKRFRPGRVRLNIPDLYVVRYDYLSTAYGQTFNLPYDLLEFRSELTKNYIVTHLEELRRQFLSARPSVTNGQIKK